MADQNSGHILVVGDFMIDREWVLSGLPSPTAQAHGQVTPMRRIHPTWNDRRLGGAGMILMALKSLCDREQLNYHLHGLGIWNENDDGLFEELSDRQTGTTKIDLHKLNVKIIPDEIVTTVKSRFYTQLAQEQPKLLRRFDQDPEPNPEVPPHQSDIFSEYPLKDIEMYFNSHGIQPQDVRAVVIADFNKGSIQKVLLEALKKYLKNNKNVFWLIDSKNPKILDLLPDEQSVDVLTMNREEAVKLYNELTKIPGTKAPEIFSIPRQAQTTIELKPSIELLSVINEISQQKSTQIKKIVIKLDLEGAYLHINQGQGEDTFLKQPEEPLDSEGIAAGDFFNARLLLSYLSETNQSNPSEFLHDACISASEWLKFSQEYWTNRNVCNTYKSDIVKPDFLNSISSDIKQRINQGNNWDVQKKFKLSQELTERNMLFDYETLVGRLITEEKKLNIANAKGFLGDFASTDLLLRKEISEFVDTIKKYTQSKGKTTPLNCLVIAEPGSGKSFFAGQVAKATGCKIVEVNCSQMTSKEALLESIAQLSDIKDETPLLFLDEVDTYKEFYPLLLAPLWDASVSVNGKTENWPKRFVSILVASKADFLNTLDLLDTPKGKDLKSRLKGPQLTLSEQLDNVTDEEQKKSILTSRVYLTADMLLRYHDTARVVERGLLDLVYHAPKFNPRSVEHFIASLPTPVDGIVSLKKVREKQLEEFAKNLEYPEERFDEAKEFTGRRDHIRLIKDTKKV